MKQTYSDIITLIKGKKVLDLGSWEGDLLQYGSSGSVGYDCDSDAIKGAERRGRNVKYGTLPNIKFNGKFDIVLIHHVLEHLPTLSDVHGTLELARKHLKEDGLLIVGTPYAYDVGAWNNWEHQRVFTMSSLTGLIKKHDFKIVDSYNYWYIPKEGWWQKWGIGAYKFKLTRSDTILKFLATFNIIYNITIIGKLER